MLRFPLYGLLLLLLAAACSPLTEGTSSVNITSPDGQLSLGFQLDGAGVASYELKRGETVVIPASGLGFSFQDAPDLRGGWKIKQLAISSKNESWEQPWGEQRMVANNSTRKLV